MGTPFGCMSSSDCGNGINGISGDSRFSDRSRLALDLSKRERERERERARERERWFLGGSCSVSLSAADVADSGLRHYQEL